ncbi:hypothetical protein P3T35_007383 [Kitasatospora sp. GP30]|nr:hypothetical protein [Kitasatospora sp. GP30]
MVGVPVLDAAVHGTRLLTMSVVYGLVDAPSRGSPRST